MTWSPLVLVLLFVAAPVVADVEIFPTFSEPVVAGESVLVASPDSKRLVCIDRAGHVRWTKVIRKLIAFGLLDEQHFYAQDGRRVSRLTIEKGSASPIITLPAGESVTIDSESGIAWSELSRVTPRLFVMRDYRTLRPLWRDDRIESVTALDPQHIFVVTATRQVEAGGQSFSDNDAQVRALDRASGREIWSHRLHDEHSFQIRGAVIGGYLVIAEGVMPTNVTVLDATSGAVGQDLESTSRGSRGVFDVEKLTDEEALMLETMRDDGPDRLTTVSIPELRMKSSISLPAQENLVFFRDGDVIVTSGIYSAAAFDSRGGTKRWEIGHQLLLGRPRNGVLYATRSDQANDLAVLERIDLRTGEESQIYSEPLPPSMTAAARKRDRENWEKNFAASEKARHAGEPKAPTPDRNEVCLRFDQSGMLDVRQYWILHRGGKAEFLDADTNFEAVREFGRWSRDPNGDYTIRGTPLVRNVQTGELAVTVGVKANIPLLSDLRDVIESFVRAREGRPASTDELRQLQIRAPGCPPEAQSYCTVAGERVLTVTRRRLIEMDSVSVDALEKLMRAIDDYGNALADADVIRFRLRSYRSYTFAEWIDPHSYWQSDDDVVPDEIDGVMDFSAGRHDRTREPALFRLAPCSEVANLLKPFANALAVP